MCEYDELCADHVCIPAEFVCELPAILNKSILIFARYISPYKMETEPSALDTSTVVLDCQGATPTSDKARRPTPTTGDRGRRWRLRGKEGPASKVLSGTYENVAEVGTGRVVLSMQRLRQGYTTK